MSSLFTISIIFAFNLAHGSVFQGKCHFVPPSPSFDPNQILGEWDILQTTDPVLKENSKCAHSHISEIQDGILINFSNHFKNGSVHDYNVTLTSVKDKPGFYTTIAINPEFELTKVTYFVESGFFMVWICAAVSTHAHMEQMYIDGPSANIPEEIIQTFFDHLSSHDSHISRDSLSPLPQIGCPHK